MRVLVVDDGKELEQAIVESLRAKGIEVVVASDYPSITERYLPQFLPLEVPYPKLPDDDLLACNPFVDWGKMAPTGRPRHHRRNRQMRRDSRRRNRRK